MQHLINESINILLESFHRLIFIYQPNLVMESEIHLSLHQQCYYQLRFVKLIIQKLIIDLPINEKFGIVSIHIGFIQRAINYFPCERSLPEKHVNEKTYILAKAIKNIFSNFIILHETVLCNYRNPQWISNKIKRKILKEKNTARQSYVQNRKNE